MMSAVPLDTPQACHAMLACPGKRDGLGAHAGTLHSRAQVGVPLLLTKQDLKRVAPLWMHYTRQVRLDPTVR